MLRPESNVRISIEIVFSPIKLLNIFLFQFKIDSINRLQSLISRIRVEQLFENT